MLQLSPTQPNSTLTLNSTSQKYVQITQLSITYTQRYYDASHLMLSAAEETSAANHWQAEPASDAEHDTPKVLAILALVLERLVGRNDQLVGAGNGPMSRTEVANGHGSAGSGSAQMLGKNIKVFDGVRAPSIALPKYLERIYKYSKCSPSCFVVGYVYIDRLVHRHPELLVVSLNVHRLLVTSVMVASKMLDDEHYDNAFYARVGGVSNAEINRLELELLFMLDFDVMVKAPEFEIYCFYLEREMSRLTADGITLGITSLDKPSILEAGHAAATTTFSEDGADDVHEIEVQLA